MNGSQIAVLAFLFVLLCAALLAAAEWLVRYVRRRGDERR